MILWIAELLRGLNFFGLSYLEWVGLLVTLIALGYYLPLYLYDVYIVLIAPALKRGLNLRKMGKWAVVTGATDGIGKAYAEEIARLGINIVLISRSQQKLATVSNEIENTFGVITRTIAVDFTEGVTVYDKIERELQGLEIGILVNNVGIWYPYVDYFTDLPYARKHSQDMIYCNVIPVTFLTHLVLPQMVGRRRGVIINVGGLTGAIPVPFISMYSATKVFVERFSESLAMEYKRQGITIQVVLPGYVATKMARVSKPSVMTPSPTLYVQKALKTVGIEDRTAVYIPHRLALKGFEWGYLFFKTITGGIMYERYSTMREISKRRREAKFRRITIQEEQPLTEL
ncbi:unnamed protein product [Allacma fusca]|uniref:Uncharacterized protein n=1 Tax=Allacma fusca TaxID=39272 RepID=A0A8J2Q3R2_9HEXA|nr:unnamed protein product [Allacma fusca]